MNLRWSLSFNKVVSTRRISEICQKLANARERRPGAFIVEFEQIPLFVPVFPLLTLNK